MSVPVHCKSSVAEVGTATSTVLSWAAGEGVPPTMRCSTVPTEDGSHGDRAAQPGKPPRAAATKTTLATADGSPIARYRCSARAPPICEAFPRRPVPGAWSVGPSTCARAVRTRWRSRLSYAFGYVNEGDGVW